jgi:hypothetical protein
VRALIVAAAVALLTAGAATAGPRDWIPSCVHSDHPASQTDGCGWLAAPGRYVLCHNYPDGIQMQLTCYAPRSGWHVNIPHDDPPGKRPSERRLTRGGLASKAAFELPAGETWYDSMPERTAETVCRATTHWFRCELRAYRVTFRPDGSFVLERSRMNTKTYATVYTVVARGR